MKSIDYPDDWDEELMGELGEFRNGIDFSSDQQGSGTKIINVNNLYESAYVDLSNLKRVDISRNEIRRFRLNENDIIFGRSSKDPDGVGQAVLFEGFEEPVTHAGFTIRMRPDTQVLNPYFFINWLRSPNIRQRVISLGREATLTNISQDDLSKIKVPIPEFEEQRRIASVLYSVDEQLRVLHDRHDRLSELKHGLMQDLLTGNIRTNGNIEIPEELNHDCDINSLPEKSPRLIEQSHYNEIPDDWFWTSLSEICSIQSGTSDDQVEEETDIPVSRIETIADGTVNMDSVRYIEGNSQNYQKYKYEYGDLIFSNINSEKHIGKTAIFDLDEDLYHGMNLLRLHSIDINPFYMYYLFNLPSQKRIWKRTSQPAVNQCSINQTMLKQSRIPIAPKEEQEQIASVLYTVDEMIARTSDLRDEYERLKRGLMQDLLSGDVRTPEQLTVLDEISTDASNSGTGTDEGTQRTLDV